MYAAAGGTACRAARKRQQQQAVKEKAEKAKALKEKLAQSKADLTAPPKSKQFHQLPANYYLRAPYTGMRKLSAGYTGHSSKLLLPINEQSAQQHSPSHQQLSHHHEKQPRTPSHHRGDLRLDVEHHKTLTKSATASFPLVSQACTPPTTNNLCPFHHPQQFKESQSNLLSVANDGIIITPATPLPSPTPSGGQQQGNQTASVQDLRVPKISPNGEISEDMHEFPPLERTCSVYRNRKIEAETTKFDQQSQFYIGSLPNGHQTQFADEFCDAENRVCVCTCDRVECAQGRQAWLERGRRCSVQDPSQASYHRRWKNNRIQDSSIGGSSDDEDILGVIRGPSTFANAFLYIGLGTISIGSIIFFVGTGEKGFKTQELRLIGPALALIGFIFCIIRILFCVCPSHCIRRRDRNKKSAKVDVDHRTSLLGDTKRVSIARGPYINSKIPMSSSHSSQFPPKSIVKNKSYEGVEALRQIASTSLFLDNEQQPQQQRHTTIIPTIKEPLDEGSSNASLKNLFQAQDALLEPPIEMMKMNTLQVDTLNVIDILSLTDEESERELRQIDINQEVVIPKVEPSSLFLDDQVFSDAIDAVEELRIDEIDNEKRTSNKLNRQRMSLNQSKTPKDGESLLMETSLTILDNVSLSPPPYTPPPLPLSPNIVATTFNLPPSTLSLTLPLENTTTDTSNTQQPTTSSASRKHRHHHHHHHHHKGSQHKHRHSTAIGRTAPIEDEQGQPIKDSHQLTEAELVLSPSKLGQ